MKKLNGYRASHRNKWKLITEGILSLQELSLLEYYADIFDFDINHEENYGLFEVRFEELAKVFRCKSDTTVRNWHNKLLQVGFIKPTKEKLKFQLSCHARYITPGFWKGESARYAEQEKDQSIEIILQNFGIEFQKNEKKFQSDEENREDLSRNKGSRAIGSSKDEYKDYSSKKVVIKQEPRTEVEYKKIYQEGGYTDLTPDDMKWIDENITETLEAPMENEQEIIDLYFNGNAEEYKRNLR